MTKPGPKRSININDNVIVSKVGSTFVRVEFEDGSTRTFRPAEVKLLKEEPPYGMENEPRA